MKFTYKFPQILHSLHYVFPSLPNNFSNTLINSQSSPVPISSQSSPIRLNRNTPMTNPNAVVSDPQSAIAMAIAAVNTTSLYPPNPPCNITLFSRNKFPVTKSIETAVSAAGTHSGITKNNAWVEAMRSSSPTRNSSDDSEDKKDWIMKHPSALGMFEEIMSAAKMKQVVIFLDYDGTLSPIVENPDHAYMDPQMRDAVKNVAKYFPTAIVSGRCRAKVYNFVRLSELYYAGSHGMDIKGPSSRKHQQGNQNVLCQPAKEFLPTMTEVYKILMEKTKDIVGSNVENNKFCLSVHYRCVEEESWSDLVDRVKLVLEDYPMLKLTRGRMVLEIRPTIKWDKGNAIEFLMESLGYANSKDVLPIYIGDDRTDEDAFRVLRKRGQGFGILVSKIPKETEAIYSLKEPTEVMRFLQRLVTWKRSILRNH